MGARNSLLLIVGVVAAALNAIAWLWWMPSMLDRMTAYAGGVVGDAAITSSLHDLFGMSLMDAAAGFTFGSILILATVWLAYSLVVRRRLGGLVTRASVLAGMPISEASATLERLGEVIGQLGQVAQGETERLSQESRRLAELEADLRDSEARYANGLRGANDGLWEWDLKADQVQYAGNWAGLLGNDADSESIDDWYGHVHEDDRAPLRAAIESHLCGEAERIETDIRLRRADGKVRWFLARGRAVRSASGAAQKVIGLITDITERKRAEEILIGIANGLAEARGDQFFKVLVRNFAAVLGVKCAFITQCVGSPVSEMQMLAWWDDNGFRAPIRYDLNGTPCQITISTGESTLIQTGVEAQFPSGEGLDSYFGLPIFDADGRILGHIACFDSGPIRENLLSLPIFTIFAVRAGAEMEFRMLREAGSRPH